MVFRRRVPATSAHRLAAIPACVDENEGAGLAWIDRSDLRRDTVGRVPLPSLPTAVGRQAATAGDGPKTGAGGLVESTGFEPVTSAVQRRRSTR